jgi:hypothetical protein
MSMNLRLLGIAAVICGFGPSEALPAGDVWKGSWKFEIDRQDQPWLGYYDTRGKTVLRIGCGAHFDMRAVYPAAPKQDDTKASITIANGKMQMDFAGVIDAGTEYDPPQRRFSTSRTSATPAKIPNYTKINGTRWKIASSIFWTPDSR